MIWFLYFILVLYFYIHNKIYFSSVCSFWQKVQFPNTLQIKRWLHKVLLSHIEHTRTPLSTSLTQKHISCHFPFEYTHSLWFWQNCHAWRPYSRQRSNKESERAMDGWMGGDGGVCVCHLVSEHKWHWGGGKVGWWRGRGKIRQQSGHLFQPELRMPSENECGHEPRDSKWSFVK